MVGNALSLVLGGYIYFRGIYLFGVQPLPTVVKASLNLSL